MRTSIGQKRPESRAVRGLILIIGLWAVVAPALTYARSHTRQPQATSSVQRADRTRALLVGGGPSPEHNQIAIESNLRYLDRMIAKSADRTVLYADGAKQKEIVLFESSPKTLRPAEKLLALLLADRESAHPANLKYRKPSLAKIDGPAQKSSIVSAFDRFAAAPANSTPLVLYFTGHGSQTRPRDVENSQYDLWSDGGFTVRELAVEVARLPAGQPVTLVMVQCYAGAFANLLFQDGDPTKGAVERDIVGFFATIKERMAAGCTPEVNEAEYHDFTSYFFAALSGRDRVGRQITGADYNRDGRVGMDEAFCYTLIHNASIDVPVCMSDVYLRKVVPTPDAEVFQRKYSEVLNGAAPAQRAALEQLSLKLKLSGEDRAREVYLQVFGPERVGGSRSRAAWGAFLEARENSRRLLFSRWPDLRDPQSSAFASARVDALSSLGSWIEDGRFKEVLEADDLLEVAEADAYRGEIEEARLLRFVRLFKSVVLAQQLRAAGDTADRKRFECLVAAEARVPAFLAGASEIRSAVGKSAH